MVPDAIEGFFAEIEGHESDVGAPHCVVIAIVKKWFKGIFACVAPRTVPAVVSDRNRLGKVNVESEWASN